MRALLTGAGGFLGATVAKELEAAGHEVSGLGLTGRGGWPAVDLTDPEAAVEAVLGTSPDAVIHLAGEASATAAQADPERAFRTNATTTWNLLEAVSSGAPDAFFVLGSSAAVYGRPDPAIAGRIPETAPVEPVSVYGASKAAAEMITGGYSAPARPAVAILRAFNLIGPDQRRGVAADLMAIAKQGGDVLGAVRNPESTRDFTDVRDAARAIVQVASARASGTFNLCSGVAVTIAELGETVVATTGEEDRTQASSPSGARRSGSGEDTLVGDPTRLSDAVGWEAGIGLLESIAAMAAETGS